MSRDEHIIVIHPGLEQRTSSKTGKQRYNVALRAEPMIFNLDPKTLGKPIAAAIVHHLRERVRGITAAAAPATQKARKVAKKAVLEGKAWALRQYTGGRTGTTPITDTVTAFNASGRFAKSIVGSPSSDGHWRVNVAANRLNPQMGNVDRIWTRLVSLVPEFGNPGLFMQSDVIRAAVKKAQKAMVSKDRMSEGFSIIRALEVVAKAVEVFESFGDLLSTG